MDALTIRFITPVEITDYARSVIARFLPGDLFEARPEGDYFVIRLPNRQVNVRVHGSHVEPVTP